MRKANADILDAVVEWWVNQFRTLHITVENLLYFRNSIKYSIWFSLGNFLHFFWQVWSSYKTVLEYCESSLDEDSTCLFWLSSAYRCDLKRTPPICGSVSVSAEKQYSGFRI